MAEIEQYRNSPEFDWKWIARGSVMDPNYSGMGICLQIDSFLDECGSIGIFIKVPWPLTPMFVKTKEAFGPQRRELTLKGHARAARVRLYKHRSGRRNQYQDTDATPTNRCSCSGLANPPKENSQTTLCEFVSTESLLKLIGSVLNA